MGQEAPSAIELAMADEAAAPLPDDPRPARSPFTGFAIGMLLLGGPVRARAGTRDSPWHASTAFPARRLRKSALGARCLHSRSRAAVTVAATGAAILLAVPVVALGQVPGVDQVVGGVNQAVQDVVKAAPAPPVRLPAPAQAPKPAPVAPAPAPAASAPAPSAPAPAAQAPTRSATASASQSSGGTTSAHASGGTRSKAGEQGGGVRAHAAADQDASGPGASASQTDT